MTTMSIGKSNGASFALVLVGLAVVAILALAVLGTFTLPQDHHAIQRHGQDGQAVYDYIENLKLQMYNNVVGLQITQADRCRYDNCNDGGHTHYVCQMSSSSKCAVAIYSDETFITGWTTTCEKAAKYKDGCTPFINWAH